MPPGATDLVICSRVADKPDPTNLYAGPSAIQVPCADCRAPVWYNPATVVDRASATFTPVAHIICEPCARAYGYEFARLPTGRG